MFLWRGRRTTEPRSDRGHEVFYIASPDNVCGRPFNKILRQYYGDEIELKEPLPRGNASGISVAKAQKMLGYSSWRDYLDERGGLKPGAGEGGFFGAA